jgi:SAM-dependent methyltransferase
MQLRRANRELVLGQQESIENWLYDVNWRTQLLWNRMLPADSLASPPEVSALLVPQLEQLSRESGIEDYQTLFGYLDTLTVEYVLQAFAQMGWDFDHEASLSVTTIMSRLGIIDKYQGLTYRFLEMLSEEGLLQHKGNEWQVIATIKTRDPHDHFRLLLEKYPKIESELLLIERCGSRLPEVLRGELDPLQLIFPEGDLTTATKLYQDTPGSRVMNTLIQQAVLSAVKQMPQGRGTRILEIGAGTGGTTSFILPHLSPDQTEYVFTDISPLFITKAKETFSEYPFVNYETLDIESDPVDQGFGLQRYDIIIAANVLHATRDLHETLSNIKQLLAPGGMLILLEITIPKRWIDIVFGLTEGWWRFTDKQLRPLHPLLSGCQWQDNLRGSGFLETEVICPKITAEEILPEAVIICKGPD